MARTSASFKRGAAKYKPQPRVLVICEDTKSSKYYLEDAAIHFRTFALVEFSHCGRTDPLGVVEGGIKRSKDFEKVFCVIDRDSHDRINFESALAAAASHPKTTLLTSYPCFEFWLLLHFNYTRAPFNSVGKASAADRVIRELRAKQGMEDYAKGSKANVFQQLLPQLDDACERAKRTLLDAEKDQEKNPSTPLHTLIEELKGLGNLKPAD